MSSKVSAFCIIIFLLFFTLYSAAAASQDLGNEKERDEMDGSCQGNTEEEDCLMRRTLIVASLDYGAVRHQTPRP
ncbi:hypothetical protein ERO13_A12G018500v2 [Gossypium hirsutum]|uniref:Phytosulfokine n=5 Tax=Gossypium TaxID=3633 RepID=A0ABR0MKD8_GOSAR|nr:hypothetical protein ES319_A12G018300v1 [Gossypium barbadense]KAG4168369.1 hypothetical protein ERO13_A12G018500v2 [Gossypium hirsutum]KAK5774471.1 hypothetical protein PVK06_042326 [Gossypium arboreum]TYG88407.1 hypothetical protein ES288_A12G018800v1 [Gossypium darwinii]TYH94125.1 hypothetical protein ES332_A12G019500v1 [Gossypium tomentosum]TYJ03318.1 hypothetical protein E1A91_A12G019400v1 [Gossypium mustelinum]